MERHFIVVGTNNYWCTNFTVSADKDVEKAIKREIKMLKASLDYNKPEKFIIYETISPVTKPFMEII